MHTLEKLRSGELAGITRLDLNVGIDHFPEDIFGLADTLEVLNLSDNNLTSLPHDLSRLRKLRVVFCSGNPFTVLPEALGDCPNLEMVGFKSCRVQHVPAHALPSALRWLILTDNDVTTLPDALGSRPRLQKLMLAGNRLDDLPSGLAEAQRLELLRIAANRFEQLPDWLLTLPRLAWLAFAGNPLSERHAPQTPAVAAIERSRIEFGDILGQGASGVIRRAIWHKEDVSTAAMAVKTFKGEVTSDGLPGSEMAACLAAGNHSNLVPVAGPLTRAESEPDALLLELIDPAYGVLAGPPSLASCTRDVYSPGTLFTADRALAVAQGVADAGAHLHARGILHGDLYAHNLLVDSTGHALLSDFGAASFFDPASSQGVALQRIEARAFGCLLEELLEHVEPRARASLQPLADLKERCLDANVAARPRLSDAAAQLRSFALEPVRDPSNRL
ncbi:leucine-rich repeat-containing protein kinase family protein [Pseudomonas matsuisoli]|uniref:Protein kinase domain-containing protein n=1 Tax=Pseudomonas matsuisoli TaxID=1515666 RepID=A0A917PMQ4_9PSED|nr:leucine-rich repeat-containing protein kinase family protein [Pseudomonas matsuisoli]GGJ84938.1 hypothetical protein GCM10009304_08670 [Pseudomonas matsuisoli]